MWIRINKWITNWIIIYHIVSLYMRQERIKRLCSLVQRIENFIRMQQISHSKGDRKLPVTVEDPPHKEWTFENWHDMKSDGGIFMNVVFFTSTYTYDLLSIFDVRYIEQYFRIFDFSELNKKKYLKLIWCSYRGMWPLKLGWIRPNIVSHKVWLEYKISNTWHITIRHIRRIPELCVIAYTPEVSLFQLNSI